MVWFDVLSAATCVPVTVGRDVPAASVAASSAASRAVDPGGCGRRTSMDAGMWTRAGTATAPGDDGQ